MKQRIRLPEPTGEYPVGLRHEMFWTRDEQEEKPLSLTIYYPAEPDTGQGFAPYACRQVLEAMELSEEVETCCQLNAEISRSGPFPLILFNHGYLTYEMCNTVLCTDLASHGFITAAIGHTGEAVVELPGGKVLPKEQKYIDMVYDPELDEKVEGIIEEIERMTPEAVHEERLTELIGEYHQLHSGNLNLRADIWQQHIVKAAEFLLDDKNGYAAYLDTRNGVGLTGHSFGGAAAANCCADMKLFSCGVNMDGAQIGSSFGRNIGKPFMCMSGSDGGLILHDLMSKNQEDTYHAVFHGTEHMGFTDRGILAALVQKELPGTGKQNPEEVRQALTALQLQFFKKYLADENAEVSFLGTKEISLRVKRKAEGWWNQC